MMCQLTTRLLTRRTNGSTYRIFLILFINILTTELLYHPNAGAFTLSATGSGRNAVRTKANTKTSLPDYLSRIQSILNSTSGLPKHRGRIESHPSYGFPPATTESAPVWYDPPSELVLGYVTGAEKYPGSDYLTPGQLISGAITYAVKKVNDDPNILPNTTLRFVIAETHGYEIESLQKTALLIQQNISAIIGPQETCMHEARLAAAFNVPMISYYCTASEVSNRELYPTFARTKPTDSQISGSVVSILKRFNWKRITFIHQLNKEYNITAETILKLMREHDIIVSSLHTYSGPYFHAHQLNPFIKIVRETRHNTRIYVMLGESNDFVGLLDHLQDLGLLDTGAYFVVGVTRDTYDLQKPQEFLQGIFEYIITNKTVLAYRHFFSIVHTPPLDPKYNTFKQTVDNYLELPPFNLTNHLKEETTNISRMIKPEASYLYDAVMLYAEVLTEIIHEGGDYTDGRLIVGRIQGRTYKSAFGYLTKIDDNGDTQGNFSLIMCKQKDGLWGMFPVGTFQQNPEGGSLPVLHGGDGIHWIHGEPPPDEPECGFKHERCIPEKTFTTEIAAGVAGTLVFFSIIGAYILYNNWRYEQELAGLLWKIDFYKDIELTTNPYFNSAAQSSMYRSSSQTSLMSVADLDIRQLFTHVAIYKGNVVAIRKVEKTHVELTRSVKKELKTLRELRHDNINPFIGACVEPPCICIVVGYCSKGSLQDILENEDIQLDSMFIASLVFDIIKGMIYLHGSEVISHGRLKSSNCIVDSRWVLKVTDFGLHEFTSGEVHVPGEYAKFRNLLWKAPELIRDRHSPARGTQEGDVYSFAIILFEMHSRNGPYGLCELTPKEIVERVITKDENGLPFRPRLSEISSTPKFITDVIKECWDEDSLRRPDFKSLRTQLKPMQKGMKSSIFDNMMAIMEKYASNLESLVHSRTDELIEEKKKTEELLQDMLPGAVADQLMHGKQVEAESFDSVTIFFSDICGFTALSSESTPMQIVDMLNSLYTLFDSIIEYYDVYKVETIGDAYMVVSGLPKKNGNRHAGEVASMALNLLQELVKFKIPHRLEEKIRLRIGIHSGPVVAGVVGRKMPRYCLFGDTVNVASRMESTGQALAIHISETTTILLMQIGGFELQERGNIDIKGKGFMKTYWLLGEDQSRQRQRVERGIARIERTGSTRRRARHLEHKPATPTFNLRCEDPGGSPQLIGSPVLTDSNHAMSQSLSGSPYNSIMNCGLDGQSSGGGSLKFQSHTRPYSTTKSPYSNFLHPYSHFVGPTSQELMRRSSSRRRRLKFAIGGAPEEETKKDDDSLCGVDDNLEALEFTADALPTIVRGKVERDCADSDTTEIHGEKGETLSFPGSVGRLQEERNRKLSSVSFENDERLRSAHQLPQNNLGQFSSERQLTYKRPETKAIDQSKFSFDFEKLAKEKIKAPLVRIESFDCDSTGSPGSLRAGHDSEQRSLSADDASIIFGSSNCDSPQISLHRQRRQTTPQNSFKNRLRSYEKRSENRRIKDDISFGDKVNASGRRTFPIANSAHNHSGSISCDNIERNNSTSAKCSIDKLLRNSNGVVNNFSPSETAASTRVSPISGPFSGGHFGVGISRPNKDEPELTRSLESYPLPEPRASQELNVLERKGNAFFETNAQKPKIRRSSCEHARSTNNVSDAVSLEMIPLLGDRGLVLECGFYKHDCDKDELV